MLIWLCTRQATQQSDSFSCCSKCQTTAGCNGFNYLLGTCTLLQLPEDGRVRVAGSPLVVPAAVQVQAACQGGGIPVTTLSAATGTVNRDPQLQCTLFKGRKIGSQLEVRPAYRPEECCELCSETRGMRHSGALP